MNQNPREDNLEARVGSALFSMANVPVVLLDDRGRILRFNRACERLSGYSEAEATGREVWDLLLLPEEVSAARKRFAEVLNGQPDRRPQPFENGWRSRTGEVHRIAWTGAVLPGEGGAPGAVLGIGEVSFPKSGYANLYGLEVTDLRRDDRAQESLAEAEALRIDEREQALTEDETRLMLALKAARMVAWELDLPSGIVRQSDNAADLFERPILDAGDAQQFIHPDDLARVQRQVQTAIKNGDYYHVQYRRNTPPGESARWLEDQGVALRDGDGQVRKVLGVVMEITEDMRQKDALQAYAFELERLNRELEDFAFVASRDLMEPLRKVQSFTKLLNERYQVAGDPQGYNLMIRQMQAVERLRRMVAGLLEYSLAASRRVQPVPVDINVLAADMLARRHLPQEGVKVSVGSLPVVAGNALRLQYVLTELLRNAIRFRRFDRPLEVSISAVQADGMLGIRVEDNGQGFPPDFADKIFLPFTRLHGRTENDSIGMGLAIAHKIAERHGGRLEAESRGPGLGAAFTLWLPEKARG